MTHAESSSHVLGSAVQPAGPRGLSPTRQTWEERGWAGGGGTQSGTGRTPSATVDLQPQGPLLLPRGRASHQPPPANPTWLRLQKPCLLLGYQTSPAAQARKRGHPEPSLPWPNPSGLHPRYPWDLAPGLPTLPSPLRAPGLTAAGLKELGLKDLCRVPGQPHLCLHRHLGADTLGWGAGRRSRQPPDLSVYQLRPSASPLGHRPQVRSPGLGHLQVT